MRLFAMLFLALSLVATGGVQLGVVGSAPITALSIEAASETPGQNTLSARICLNSNGATVPAGMTCQTDKRNWDEPSDVASPSWVSLQLWPLAAAFGTGHDPAPDLDPPRHS